MGEIKVGKPTKGMPSEFENPLQEAIYRKLEAFGIDYLRVENEPAVTMDDCKAIDRAFGEKTIKTVFLTNRQRTKFYLLSMPGNKPFVTRLFGAAMLIPRVSFADEETLKAILGTPHGAATPLSVIHDRDGKVEMAIDVELLDREKIVIPDGTLHGYICLQLAELIDKYLDGTGHKPHLIRMEENNPY